MSYNNNSQGPVKPILKKPPGYKDPNTPPLPPPPRPPPSKPTGYPKKPPLPPSLRNNTTTKNNKKINRRRRQPIKRRRNWRRTSCCCFCISLLVLLTILGVSSGVFYLWYRPKLPVILLRAVHFDRFNASAGKSDDDDGASIVHLDSYATVWLEVKNPNGKLTVYFGGTEAALAVEQDTDLGFGTRPEFTEGAGNVTALKFVVRVDKVEIDAGTAQRLKARVKSRAVKVKVTVKTKIGFGAGKRIKVGMLPVGVDCGGGNGVTLKQLSDGRPPKCKINFFRWMKLNG